MILSHPRFHLGVFGGSGTGKTTYAERFLCGVKSEAVFIFDPEGEFASRLHLPWVSSFAAVDAAVLSGWVCFDPMPEFGEQAAGLDYFCRYAYAASSVIKGRKFFVVDELGRYTNGNQVPDSLKKIVQAGRRVGLDGVFMAQQPNELHNTVRCQLSEVVCFQLTDATALEFPRQFGFDVDAIRALRPFQFIARNNQGAQIHSEAPRGFTVRRRPTPQEQRTISRVVRG